MDNLSAEDKVLIRAALSIATGHWAAKGHKRPPFSEERQNAHRIADKFEELFHRLVNEASVV